MFGAEGGAGPADREDFRVGGRVGGLGDQVGAFGENFPVLHDDRRERPAALLDVAAGQIDGVLCEIHCTP